MTTQSLLKIYHDSILKTSVTSILTYKDITTNNTINVNFTCKRVIINYMNTFIKSLKSSSNTSEYKDNFSILYKDGTTDTVNNSNYDHVIKKVHIQSIILKDTDNKYFISGFYKINSDLSIVTSNRTILADNITILKGTSKAQLNNNNTDIDILKVNQADQLKRLLNYTRIGLIYYSNSKLLDNKDVYITFFDPDIVKPQTINNGLLINNYAYVNNNSGKYFYTIE